jgi:N-acetylmuramoyl-L-alanine amidase
MKRLILDAGHGGKDNGAECGGVREDEIALEIVYATEKTIKRLDPDIEVILMRVGDKPIPPHARCMAIMDIQPDAFISVHCNAIADDPATPYDDRKYARGFEIFYRDDEDKKLAKCVNRVVSRSGLWEHNRGIKHDVEFLGHRLAVLNSLIVPSILIETGFLSNDVERKMIVDNTQGIGEIYAHGAIDYFKGGVDA